jgi:hypothetical protein
MVHDLFEGLALPAHFLFELCVDIFVESQGSPHLLMIPVWQRDANRRQAV